MKASKPLHQRRDSGPKSSAKSSRPGLTPSIKPTVRRFTAGKFGWFVFVEDRLDLGEGLGSV